MEARPSFGLCAVLSALCLFSVAPEASAQAPPPAATTPATGAASLYADCLADAAGARSYAPQGRYLIFTCRGDAAGRFFDRLGQRAADVAYEERHPDGVYRYTERPKQDTEGLDYCRRAISPAVTECVLTFPAGTFLDR